MGNDSNHAGQHSPKQTNANGSKGRKHSRPNTEPSGLSLGRRGALAMLGATGLGVALSGSASARGEANGDGPVTGNQPWYEWDADVDAGDNGLYNLERLQTGHVHTPARTPEVVVWEDDEGIYHADTAETTVYSGTDYRKAIQTAVDSLSEGRTEKETVLVTASGTLGPAEDLTQIELPSYTILDVQGTIYVEDTGDQPMVIPIRAFDEEAIEIPRLTVRGNPRFGIWIQDTDDIRLGDIDIRFSDTDGFDYYWEVDAPAGRQPRSIPTPAARRFWQIRLGRFVLRSRSNRRPRSRRPHVGHFHQFGLRRGRPPPRRRDVRRRTCRDRSGHRCRHGGSAVILNETENAAVNNVVGENPESPTWYATFRCANGCENVSVGQVVSRDAPRGIHLTTDSNEITIGEVNIIGARYHGIVVDAVENITIQGGLVKNVVRAGVTSTANGFSVSNLHIVDDLSEEERAEITLPDGDGAPDDPTQTRGIEFFGRNGRIVNNDVRDAGEENIEVNALNTIVRDNLGGGYASGTVTLTSGGEEAARISDIHERFNADFDLRAELEEAPSSPTAWSHYFEWTGDAWDLVIEWETDPGENLTLSYVIDKTQASEGSIDLETVDAGTYRLNANHTGMPVTADGDNVVMDEWDGADDQRWIVEEDGDLYRIELEGTGEVLSVEDGDIDDGQSVVVAEDTGAAHQRWSLEPIFTPDGEFVYTIHPDGADQGFDVEGANEAPGTNIILWDHDGTAHNQFVFDEL